MIFTFRCDNIIIVVITQFYQGGIDMKAKKACKKALSIVLALTLMLTTFVCFDIGALFGSAVDTSSAVTVSDNNVSCVLLCSGADIS